MNVAARSRDARLRSGTRCDEPTLCQMWNRSARQIVRERRPIRRAPAAWVFACGTSPFATEQPRPASRSRLTDVAKSRTDLDADARWRHADHGLRLEPKLRANRVLLLALRVLVGFLRRCRDEQRRCRETRRTGPCEPPQVLHHHSTLNLAGLHELYWPLWRSTSASAIIFGCFQSLHRPRWPAPLVRPAQRKSTSSSFPGMRTTDRPQCPRSTPRPAARSRAPSARGNFRRSPTSCSSPQSPTRAGGHVAWRSSAGGGASNRAARSFGSWRRRAVLRGVSAVSGASASWCADRARWPI